MTLRFSDSNAEQELAKFLDKFLCSNIQEFNARRTYNRGDQLKEIDIILSNVEDLTELVIDENVNVNTKLGHYIGAKLGQY